MGWSPNLFAPLCSVGNTLILNSPTTSMRKSYSYRWFYQADSLKLNTRKHHILEIFVHLISGLQDLGATPSHPHPQTVAQG